MGWGDVGCARTSNGGPIIPQRVGITQATSYPRPTTESQLMANHRCMAGRFVVKTRAFSVLRYLETLSSIASIKFDVFDTFSGRFVRLEACDWRLPRTETTNHIRLFWGVL